MAKKRRCKARRINMYEIASSTDLDYLLLETDSTPAGAHKGAKIFRGGMGARERRALVFIENYHPESSSVAD